MGALIEVNTDGLAKLGEILCNATGLAAFGMKKNTNAKVYDMIEIAKAENQVGVMKLEGKDAIDKYIAAKEQQKVSNILQVSEKAAKEFSEEELVTSESVNTDWTTRFFNIVEDISDSEMQLLWAKILAGEIKQPKSFSLRTLEVLKNISKEEAEIFLQNAGYTISSTYLYSDNGGANLSDALMLSEIGLINLESLYLNLEFSKDKVSNFDIGNSFFQIQGDNSNLKRIDLSVYSYTTIGLQLLKISTFEPNYGIISPIIEICKQKGAVRVTEHKIQYREEKSINYFTQPQKVYELKNDPGIG